MHLFKQITGLVLLLVLATTSFTGCGQYSWAERHAMNLAVEEIKKKKGWDLCFAADVYADDDAYPNGTLYIVLVQRESGLGERLSVDVYKNEVIGFGPDSGWYRNAETY